MDRGNRQVKIGVGSYAFRWAVGTRDGQPAHSLASVELLDKAAALGAEVVQICDNVPLAALPDNALAALAKHAIGLGLDLEVGIRGSRPEQLSRALQVAQLLGARVLRVVLADGEWRPSGEQAVALLRGLLPDLRAAGVTLAIENRFSLTPTELASLVSGIPCKINVIPFNEDRRLLPGLCTPGRSQVDAFAGAVRDEGLTVTVRWSRGRDVAAACGQLKSRTINDS